MKKTMALTAMLTMALFAAPLTFAQTAPAAAGITVQCKDGTSQTVATTRGACRGHKGINKSASASTPAAAAPAAAPAAAAAPAPATAPTTAATPAAAPAPTTASPAAGGGNGQVWVNTGSKTKAYHCEGSKWYGKTKQGQYMTKAQAEAQGYHAGKGDKCS